MSPQRIWYFALNEDEFVKENCNVLLFPIIEKVLNISTLISLYRITQPFGSSYLFNRHFYDILKVRYLIGQQGWAQIINKT